MVIRFVLMGCLVWGWVNAGGPMMHGQHSMVVSSSTRASEAGMQILERGGNAIDAAVAVGFALAVTHPTAGNLGGGGFLVMRLKDGRVLCLDFRETAPKGAHRDMYLDENTRVIEHRSTLSHQAVGVPGTVDGLLRILEDHGTLNRDAVLAPAIALARDGFPLSASLAADFSAHRQLFAPYPASRAVFTQKGKPYARGDVWRQPDLADTLKRIAADGRAGFYAGKTAQLLVKEMERGGGLIDFEDLETYRSVYREPVRGLYRGYEIYSMPPPSSGGVLLTQMLHMLEPFDIRSMGWGSAATIHLMVEAERRAYADRAHFLGDPDFVDMPLTQLTSSAYARTRFADFDPDKAAPSASINHGTVSKESMNTTHFSVTDRHGNAVSCTTTLNWPFGAHIVVPGAGFLLNNEMDDFSIKPGAPNTYGLIGGKANQIKSDKRMLSSMTPTIVTKDDRLFLVVGSPGGSTIITTVLQVLINLIDHRMALSEAVAAPRFHHQWLPDEILHEPFAISPDTIDLLRAKGHTAFRVRDVIGDVNAILARDGQYFGVADMRNDAEAVGY